MLYSDSTFRCCIKYENKHGLNKILYFKEDSMDSYLGMTENFAIIKNKIYTLLEQW